MPKVTETPSQVVSSKKRTVKKATAKKETKKATTKKATAKKATKAAPKEPKDPNAISDAQMRVLKVIAGGGKDGVDRPTIEKKGKVHATTISNLAGYLKPEINERKVHAGNLLNRGLVKIVEDEDTEGHKVVLYAITAKGKKVAAKG